MNEFKAGLGSVMGVAIGFAIVGGVLYLLGVDDMVIRFGQWFMQALDEAC